MIAALLSALFPPRLGKVEDVGAVLLAHALRTGTLHTVEADPWEAGIVGLYEYPEGRDYQPRRLR